MATCITVQYTDCARWDSSVMERDTSSIPIHVLAIIIASASQDVADIIKWRRISRSFKIACMQVLQDKIEALHLNEPGRDTIDSQAVQPILAKSPKALKAALRMCPSLQTIQWQQTSPLSKSISALMVSCCLHLTHLSLSTCKVPHAALSVLGQSRSLQVLNLQRCRILSNHLEAWQGFPQLRCLDISCCTSVSSDNLLLFAPQLLSLSVHGCSRMDKPLCSHLSKCVCLDICGTDVYDTGELLALIEGAPDLRHLFILEGSGNFWVNIGRPQTERAVSELWRRRPGLVVRLLTSPLHSSYYERLGTEPSPSSQACNAT